MFQQILLYYCCYICYIIFCYICLTAIHAITYNLVVVIACMAVKIFSQNWSTYACLQIQYDCMDLKTNTSASSAWKLTSKCLTHSCNITYTSYMYMYTVHVQSTTNIRVHAKASVVQDPTKYLDMMFFILVLTITLFPTCLIICRINLIIQTFTMLTFQKHTTCTRDVMSMYMQYVCTPLWV